MEDKKEIKIEGVPSAAIVLFLISVAACSFLTGAAIVNKNNIEKIKLEQQINGVSSRITEMAAELAYKTRTLAAFIVYDGGDTGGFESIAPSLVDEAVIQNVLLAPDGIVTKVYPFAENAELAGRNYFDDWTGGKEASAAVELGRFALGGPTEIMRGKSVITGSLPVFIDTELEKQKFWGIVSVMLKFPQLTDYFDLDVLDADGSAYELWRINPDTNEKQIIAGSYNKIKQGSVYTEKPLQIYNAQWFIRVSSGYSWYKQPDNIALILTGLLVSLIVFFVTRNNYELKKNEAKNYQRAITDSLTGVFNRRHFMEMVPISIEKSRRQKETCYIIMFDVDKFKNINDTYGHQIGDKVLIDITARIKMNIRLYDLFARYGGEEFIIFASKLTEEEVRKIGERLRVSLCGKSFTYNNVSLDCSASFGIAKMEDYNLDEAIRRSDEALYKAKRNGRNSVVYYGENAT